MDKAQRVGPKEFKSVSDYVVISYHLTILPITFLL